jgi:hypothetical protein
MASFRRQPWAELVGQYPTFQVIDLSKDITLSQYRQSQKQRIFNNAEGKAAFSPPQKVLSCGYQLQSLKRGSVSIEIHGQFRMYIEGGYLIFVLTVTYM